MKATWILRRRWLAPCALLVLTIGIAGCGGGAEPGKEAGKDIHLVFVTNSNADWWNAVEKGMQDGGKELGVRVELKRNDKETNGQIKLLEDVLSMPDVQGVAVSVYEAKAPGIADKLRELKEQGKLVITIDSDIAPEQAELRRAYIGTNNVKAGEAAGRAAAILRPEGGTVCVFVGTSSAANARERRDGFFQGAGSKFSRLENFDDAGNFTKAADNVQNALTKYKDVGVLLGLWSYNAARIAEQAKAAPGVRPKTSVVTFDLDELAVGHVAAGEIDATVCQNPYEMGFQGVKLLKALVQKDEKTVKDVLPDGAVRDTGVRVIVPNSDSPVMKNKEKGDDVITIDEMKSWLASKGLKCS
ncbi:MAG: substrate-binding domain-containing protein [Isosphaeraceae bacterium]|nr:substrate-binding domain-containing protein [Isosphaeraceae bacterium]